MHSNKINIDEAYVKKSGHPCGPTLHPDACDIRPTVFSQEPLPKRLRRPTKDLLSTVRYLIRHCKYDTRLKKRGYAFDLDLFYVHSLYQQQQGKCYLTGDLLTPENISIDRQDNTKGYVKGNIKLCTKVVNLMKQQCSLEAFINNCKKVVEHNEF